jgi:RNA polymerase sigma-70 factor (ECF subfamily)
MEVTGHMSTVEATPELNLDEYRGELLGYCYRMLGSPFDAEDAVQETMIRAWRSQDSFEGRSSVRSWLYRIVTNVCLDMIDSRKRRARPMDLSSQAWQPVEASLAARQPEDTWLEPMLDSQVMPMSSDPADIALGRESIRLAFVAALQYLPARQRVVVILREVLRWKADEVAALLETSVASVNSALQRARATLDERGLSAGKEYDPLDDDQQKLLSEYLAAFEAYDVDRFVQLLHEDATQNMPPFELWLQGPENIIKWMLGPGLGCVGSKLMPLVVNGAPAFAHWKPGPDGKHVPFAIQVLEVRDGKVAGITNFLEPKLFPQFGLPEHPDDDR